MSKKNKLFEEVKKQLIKKRMDRQGSWQMPLEIIKKGFGLLNFNDVQKTKLIGNIEYLECKKQLFLQNLEK